MNFVETRKFSEDMKDELQYVKDDSSESKMQIDEPIPEDKADAFGKIRPEFKELTHEEEKGLFKEDKLPTHMEVLKAFGTRIHPRWEDVIKVLHNDSYPHLFPIQAPNKLGQLLYKFTIEGYPVTTLLDIGASHSFITRTWASDKGLDLTPIRPPRPVGLFSGQKNFIRHIAIVDKIEFGDYVRTWKFYVIDSAPFPAILGADAIMSWPIFYSPLDHRIFILPELYYCKRNTGDLGGVYEYWHNRDMLQRAQCLSHRAFYGRDSPPMVFDKTPSTSDDESYRRATCSSTCMLHEHGG